MGVWHCIRCAWCCNPESQKSEIQNRKKCLEEIGCPEGTTFVIRNLFYVVRYQKK